MSKDWNPVWHPVTEKLPPEAVQVLACFHDADGTACHQIASVEFVRNKPHWLDTEDELLPAASYWMELPPLPVMPVRASVNTGGEQ